MLRNGFRQASSKGPMTSCGADVSTGPPWPALRGWFPAAFTLWLGAVLGGFFLLLEYKAAPGEMAGAPARWPRTTQAERAAGRPTLVMFAHPHCPCTRASVAELERLVGRFPQIAARVFFLKPEDLPGGWEKTDLWRSASAIPGALAIRDDDGREARLFGAMTSGFTAVYDADGALLFSGGLTSSRGHEGDSFGVRRIASLLTTGTADKRDSPVFGCALHGAPTARP
jgi:hypothetical protein